MHGPEYLPEPVARDYFIVSEMQGREQVHWHALISAGVPQWDMHTPEYLPEPVARDYFIVSEMQGREQVHWHALISAGVPQWVMQRAAGGAPAGPVA